MTQLMQVECPNCDATFEGVPATFNYDSDGNAICPNCAVETGVLEDLPSEPILAVVVPVPEGADVPAEAAEAPQKASKVDLRTKEGRALKAALKAVEGG